MLLSKILWKEYYRRCFTQISQENRHNIAFHKYFARVLHLRKLTQAIRDSCKLLRELLLQQVVQNVGYRVSISHLVVKETGA